MDTNGNSKEPLIKDLCYRLPYGVKVRMSYDKNTVETREMGLGSLHDIIFNNAEGKPYLRPMSSMTKEEKKERDFYCGYKPYYEEEDCGERYITEDDMPDYIDFLYEHHFDFRGLIEQGLALESPEGMYDRQI